MRRDIAIVIPALNEARTIGKIVADLVSSALVIVVDDGSTDGTGDIAREAGAVVVRHPVNRGYERAIESGFSHAAETGALHAITIDADGQHPSELIGEYIAAIDGGAGLVLGVRDRFQRLGEHVFSWVGRILFGVTDPMCGMKAYRLADYRVLGHFDSYGSVGTELMLHALSRGAAARQIAIVTRDRADTPRFDKALRANWRIIRAAMIAVLRYGFRARRRSGTA